jgi:LysM repeat protein
VVQRGDSLQALAVRHGVTVPCLKRVNNLMSDHALHSRTQLYIPGALQVHQLFVLGPATQ